MPGTQVRDVKAEAEAPVMRSGLAERAEELDETLTLFRTDLASDRFASAMGKFREAVNLSRAWKELRTRVLRVAVEESRALLPRNWRVAETLLSETSGLESDYSVPSEVWDKVRASQHNEVISNALYSVDRTEITGTMAGARDEVKSLLNKYPNEGRLQIRLRELEERLNPPASTPAPVVEPKKEEAPAPVDVAVTPPASAAVAPPSRIKIAIASPAWDRVKSALTVVGSAAMVLLAAFLIWLHFKSPNAFHKTTVRTAKKPPAAIVRASTPVINPIRQPDKAAAAAYSLASEEKAWQIVETTQKPEDLQLYLKMFPGSTHSIRARLKLEALQAQEANQWEEELGDWQALDHSDPKALESFLIAHASGPHAKAIRKELQTIHSKQQ